ncbi:MAG: hypothetical protein UV63_C0031G0004 [Microgenomates group bacterium GW2011_GWC1_43_11]|nr:MAG: hypothetical protein UV63_C0031G0004 [Microgenomates group bacterium GW2011_GWC1_43_11]
MQIKELMPKIQHPTEVTLLDVKKEGCFPKDAYLTGNRIEFFYHQDEWVLPQQPRMDGVVQVEPDALKVVEMNKLKENERVVFGNTEDGSQGIYVTNLSEGGEKSEKFGFMTTDISRERRVNYPDLAKVLKHAKEGNGKIVWVLGPAVVHAGGVEQMEWLIKNKFVGALLGGNAIGAHDIEHAIFGTSLGVQDNLQPAHNGHRNHLEAINAVREQGSIEAAVEEGLITRGIMYECVKNRIPFVLTASIRDDGPLPDTILNNLQGQNAMRTQTIDASCVVMLATVLHSVATGNMTPTYRIVGDEVEPIPVICVDSDEFAVTKLVDRGTSQAYPVVGNASNFLTLLVNELAK